MQGGPGDLPFLLPAVSRRSALFLKSHHPVPQAWSPRSPRPFPWGPSPGDRGVCLEEGASKGRDQSPPGDFSLPSAESVRKERMF